MSVTKKEERLKSKQDLVTTHVSSPRFASVGTSILWSCSRNIMNAGRNWLTCSKCRGRSGKIRLIFQRDGSSIGGSNWRSRFIHSRILGWWRRRRIKCIFIFRNELLSCTNPINPNQWNLFNKWSKTIQKHHDCQWVELYGIMYIIVLYAIVFFLQLDISPSDHVFHDVQPAFDWSNQHPPWIDGKPRFGGKGDVDWDKHIKSWFAKKTYMVVFSGFAWSNGSKMRQRSWNALTLSYAVGWEWGRVGKGYK